MAIMSSNIRDQIADADGAFLLEVQHDQDPAVQVLMDAGVTTRWETKSTSGTLTASQVAALTSDIV